MNYYLKRCICNGQEAKIRMHGDQVWEEMTDNLYPTFNVKQVSQLPCLAHLSRYTAVSIARCVIANVEAEAEARKDEIQAPFRRQGNTYFWN